MMKAAFHRLVWLLPLLAGVMRGTTLVYPVDAIEDLWTLPAAEFRQKHAGINATGIGPSDEGWYVRYRHENLTCLFGPLAEREEARKRKWEMEAVRDAAIRNRAALASSKVDYVRFTFSGIYGRRGEGGGGAVEQARISADGKSGPDGDLDGDGIPNSRDDDMDGDGISNTNDSDADGDGTPNEQDEYMYGTNPQTGQNGGRSGPAGDLDGDGIPNAQDGDMDGDGIPNGQDPDMDGDGIPNGEDSDPHGNGQMAGRAGEGALGAQGANQGEGEETGQMAGQKGAKSGRQAAMGQRGDQNSQNGAQNSQGAQSTSQGAQQSSNSSSQSSSNSSGQSGPPTSGGSSGSPLDIVTALLRMILGL